MPEISAKAKTALDWIFAEWSEKLASILEQMADERPKTSKGPVAEPAEADPANAPLIWEQHFTLADEPLIWVVSPADAVHQIGERTLRASGVEEMDPTDARNTFLEVLSQSLSALGQSLSDRLSVDAASTTGAPAEANPPDLHWLAAILEFADMKLSPICIGCSQQMLDLLDVAEERPAPVAEAPAAPPPVENRQPPQAQSASAGVASQSKTFDLLLDVSLSVSVSFGRTFLPIREVLKLTTGSIVELDRAVNEPVEIIVNNCVIARGEVVVVEGNYGVRINQIASRHDRLKTGSTAAEAQHALSAR